MIPRILHHIWMGDKPFPQTWGDEWVRMHPDWEYHLWDEKAIRALPLMNKTHFDWYAKRLRWNGAADIARVEILFHFGGVYVDVDSRPLLPLDDAPFMSSDFFAGFAHKERVANGTIGSTPGHPILKTYISLIGKHPLDHMLPPSRTIGSVMLTQAISMHPECNEVQIQPRRVFYPVSLQGDPIPGPETAYVEHFWAGTRGQYGLSN